MSLPMLQRVLDAWGACTPDEKLQGQCWYHNAQNEALKLSEEFLYTIPTVAGVIAALSPALSWTMNLIAAREVLRCRRLIPPIPLHVPGYGRNVVKATRIADGDTPESVLSGPKVTAFYRLIRDGGNDTDVCIDGHAINMVMGRGRQTLRSARGIPAPEFDDARDAFRTASVYLRQRPCDIQAATWVAWRASHGFAQKRIVWHE